MITLKVHHLTLYRYKKPVGFGQHRMLFRPRDSFDQRLIDWSLDIWPKPSDQYWVHDVFNNCVAVADFDTEAEELRFETNITLEHSTEPALHFRTDETGKFWPFTYDVDDLPDLRLYMQRQYPDDSLVEEWARRFVNPAGPTDTALLLETMTHAIRHDFQYAYRASPGTQTPEMTLYSLSGTCRDFALLMMEAVRALGFAARFVTGYIYVPSRDTTDRQGGGSTHAWVQVFLPGAGWVEFDPTNGIIGNRDLIRVGVARDPRQIIPLWGSHTGSRMDSLGMTVQVNVTSTDDDASVFTP